MLFTSIYPLVIKHGLLENPPIVSSGICHSLYFQADDGQDECVWHNMMSPGLSESVGKEKLMSFHGIYINMFILYMNTYIPCFSPSISKCMNVTWIDLDPSSWSEFFEDPVEDL